MKEFLTALVLCISVNCLAQSGNDIQLANEYYGQGEFEKARNIYEKLAKDLDHIPLIHNNYFILLIEMHDYKEAEKYIRRIIRSFPNNLFYQLDLGTLYNHAGREEEANRYFNELIQSIKNDTYRLRITADYFLGHQLTNLAIKTLNEGRSASNNPYAYSLEMANIYRIINKKDLMVKEYLNYVIQNPSNLTYVKNTLQYLLVKPEELEQLEMLLYDKIQDDPNSVIYSELLIWTNLQQKNFYGAFIQSRAIDKRLKTEGSRTIDIGRIALDNGDYENAIKVFSYVINEYPETHSNVLAKMYLIRAYEEKVINQFPVEKEAVRKLVNDYNKFIDETGITQYTIQALRNKALLHAFHLDEKDSAVVILQKIIDTPGANADIKARSKLDLGDIYILLEQPWESTLLYAQVEKSHKNEPLGYEAKLRNAKLSYYKGDFHLAQEHLDILKEATTREIANDAMALSLLIKDNIAFDTTETAMKQYAAIELMLFQNKVTQALEAVKKAREAHPGHSLSDEFLWLQADIEKKLGHFEASIGLLQKIVNEYDYDILSDDAFFMIGAIYDRQLNNVEKAMEIYRDFLTRYPGSVYVAEARKRFRELRGDYESIEERLMNNKDL